MAEKKKVLFICTGNSCRSQIAHGLLADMAGDRFDVFSAGSHPSRVHPAAVAVLEEWGIDISHHTSDYIDDYLDQGIDIVITVCDNARQVCPVFPGEVELLHWSIEDPFYGWDASEVFLPRYRETRNELKERIENFLKTH